MIFDNDLKFYSNDFRGHLKYYFDVYIIRYIKRFWLWLILPEDYRVKHLILLVLSGQFEGAKNFDLSGDGEAISFNMEQLTSLCWLSEKQINKYYHSLVTKNEIVVLESKNKFVSAHINRLGLDAVGENKYFRDGLWTYGKIIGGLGAFIVTLITILTYFNITPKNLKNYSTQQQKTLLDTIKLQQNKLQQIQDSMPLQLTKAPSSKVLLLDITKTKILTDSASK